jgi:hypothetical protein
MSTKVSSKARINVVDLVEAVREHPLYEHVSDENSLWAVHACVVGAPNRYGNTWFGADNGETSAVGHL